MLPNYQENVKRAVSNENSLLFISEVKVTPIYWKKFQGEVLTKLKQLVFSAFFLMLCYEIHRLNDTFKPVQNLKV